MRWVREGLVRVTVDEPTRLPDILTVSLHLRATPAEIACHLEGVTVVGADHHFIVPNTGPKLHDFASSGHYLVHDTREEKLHLVPPIDLNEYREDFGRVPVIITGAGAGASSDFLLALVMETRLCKSSARSNGTTYQKPGQHGKLSTTSISPSKQLH